jgi:hypothetical protein
MEIVQHEDTPRGTLELAAKEAVEQGWEAVVVIALDKDCRQSIRTSRTSMQEKVFMLQFFQAWISKWFFSDEG